MRLRFPVGLFAAATIAGCANASTPIAPAAQPPALARSANVHVGIWAADSFSSTIYGVTSDGGSIVSTINTAANGCDEDFGLKVDAESHLWVACEDSSKLQGGSVQEYRRNGAVLATYQGGCPKNLRRSQCESFVGDGLDVGFSAANVFVSDWTFELEWNCNQGAKVPPPCGNTQAGTGFEYWPLHRQGAKPTLIDVYGQNFGGLTINNVWYFDLDNSGNIWAGYNGCSGGTCGAGLLEVENPTSTSFAVLDRLPPGTFDGVNGVYISDAGSTVNVADDGAGVIDSYRLEPSFGAVPFRVLGPMAALGTFAHGEPVAGGFRSGDGRAVWGDGHGWLDLGSVRSNTWTAVDPGFMGHRIGAAVYATSDK
jgi:hypothetical protein